MIRQPKKSLPINSLTDAPKYFCLIRYSGEVLRTIIGYPSGSL